MALSPSRKFHSNYLTRKQTYTQIRQQNINQANLSQYSPSIRSPKLNEESDYTKLHNVGLVDELKTKLETVLKHNSHLLNQNATLSQMVNNLKMELEIRGRKQEADVVKMSAEFTAVVEELKQNIRFKEAEVARLLDQISRLHDQCYRIQILKSNEIKQLTEVHEREMATQIRNLKKSADDGKEILQLQVKKLKESIQLKNYEYQALKSTTRGENEKLKSEIDQMRNQVRHFNQLKQIQVREINQKYKQIINTSSKQTERENAITVSKLQTKIRKLKQDVVNKTIEIEQSSKKAVMASEDHQLQIENLNIQRQRLLEQINELQISGKQNFLRQKQKMRYLSELELKNLQNIAQNERDCLKSQINKLVVVCNSKTQEIKKLYNSIAEIKNTYSAEKRDNEKLIQVLRKRIKVLEEDNIQELELLKIKMAQLHDADIKGLQKYYENQVAILAKQVKELQQQKDSDREKIHKYLQQNDLLRKTFQTELTKYKAKIQDYKVKFAAAHLQFREQITSLGTKMSLTSQTLLRETQQKQKGAQFFEAQKKKFHILILNKDKEIASAHETMNKLKQLHGQQIQQLREQIRALKDNLASKINQMKEMRRQYEEQFQRKSQKIIAERHQNPNDILMKENKELRDKLENAEKQLFQKLKEIEFIQKQIKSLQQEVGLRAGFLETMQLQSSAAIEDERSKLKILMSENQVAMKDYYETKLANRNKDVEALENQLHEKQNDIRQLIVKYNQLEKRLKELLDSQERLSEFEKKIVNLGLDQNLVKNMGQLFAKFKK